MNSKNYFKLFSLIIIIFFSSCNKDDTIEEEINQSPVITLDSESGVYLTKVGKTLTIAPTIEHAKNAIYSWIIDGKLVSQQESYIGKWEKEGEVFITFRVETIYGSAQEEIRVDVTNLAPPVISLVLPSKGLKVVAGAEYIFRPDIQNKDEANFSCQWLREAQVVSTDTIYTFKENKKGFYPITIKASNIDGETSKEIIVEVVETMPYEVYFEAPSFFQTSTDRYTFTGRPVFLEPVIEYFDYPNYTWSVDGQIASNATTSIFELNPTEAGSYTVEVTVSEGAATKTVLTRNITKASARIAAQVKVHCINGAQMDNYRAASGNSSITQNKVFEYTPAPGQFINETNVAGFTGQETTHVKALEYATERLKGKRYVSLGGFGGYIIVGFDHSIPKTANTYDFAIEGNAFDGSSEPGIVWVMQDINKNGLPDDEWYELKGSETGKKETIQNHAVTYYRPSGKGMSVQWTDSEGQAGKIDYLQEYHSQDYYYPLWIPQDSYTLRGTRLKARNKLDGNIWKNHAYDWGYVDNFGEDRLEGNVIDGSGQKNGFKISNAIYRNGTPIDLKYIDFIKVQVGVNAKSGAIGEISTEVFSFYDLSIN